ncbi:hypothetical protein MMC18_006692 [Xylographa bjoerkii]|nr:hypothetical protein [Xylographa bjoerkii]
MASPNYVAPGQFRNLRACMHQKFVRDGCPNCEAFLELANHPDAVQECTSQVYEGLITLADPSTSWVARWQRLDGYVPGVYAVKVVGMVSPFTCAGVFGGERRIERRGGMNGEDRLENWRLQDEILQQLEDSGVRYIPRDGSAPDDDA